MSPEELIQFVAQNEGSQIEFKLESEKQVDRLHQAARRIDPSLHDAVKVEQVQIADRAVLVAEVRGDLSATYSLGSQFKIREGSFNRQLKIYDDRLVVGNPGGLLPGLDVTHLEGKHKARNPLLADWLHSVGYIERFGIGIIRMQEAMAAAGLPAPLLQNRPDWFEVTLLGPGATLISSEQSSASTTTMPATASPPPTTFRVIQPWHSQVWSVAGGTQQRI